MNLKCSLEFHSWHQVGVAKPLRTSPKAFDSEGFYFGHYAMGRCKRCGKESLRRCEGSYSWYSYEEITEKEYWDMWHLRHHLVIL